MKHITQKASGIRKLFLFVFLSILNFQVNAYSLKSLSDSATYYFENKNYPMAIRCYETILGHESGKDSWLLHYNLGNSYFKNHQLGFAIWHYELATKLNPGSEDARKNLEIATAKVTDKIKVKDVFIETEIQNFLVFQLTTAQWAVVSIFVFFLLLVAAYLFFFSNSTAIKRTGFWLGSISLFSFVCAMILGYIELKQTEETTYGVVVATEVKLSGSPENTSSNQNSITLHEGTRMKILSQEGQWSNIQLSNGNEGWLPTEKIRMY